MDLKTQLQAKRADILVLAAKHGAYNVRLFGSVARGEAGPKSDVDILIDLESGRSLLDQIALGQDLEELLGVKVDVVTENALHWYIKDKILQEAAPL
jgi:uncharacterized protein